MGTLARNELNKLDHYIKRYQENEILSGRCKINDSVLKKLLNLAMGS